MHNRILVPTIILPILLELVVVLSTTSTPAITPPPMTGPEPSKLTTPIADDIKRFSGVHLGNRNSDWPSTLFEEIQPALGPWPRAVVVMSNQVYNLDRPLPTCHIQGISSVNQGVFEYLDAAANAGTRVIIRIMPSPGNFLDWQSAPGPFLNHDLVTIELQSDWCNWQSHRSPYDIVAEMDVIHQYNQERGFSEFGFEAANEPNVEYSDQGYWYNDDGPAGTSPDRQDAEAWDDMDDYFTDIHDRAHLLGINVLTPPMSQQAYAEKINIGSGRCPPMVLRGTLGESGYERMENYYTGHHDGIDWHNYWLYGREGLLDCPYGNHVSMFFPLSMRDYIASQAPQLNITEADLKSPLQNGNLPDKNGDNAKPTVESLQNFLHNEWLYWQDWTDGRVDATTSVWLLSDDTQCWLYASPCDHAWHMAYWGQGPGHLPPYFVRDWFITWYHSAE